MYPIYIDAKRPCGRGERRIARAKSVWWPLSKDIADATNRLGLGTLHEVHKAQIQLDDGSGSGTSTKEIEQVGANAAVLYGPDGEFGGDYRKTNLYTTDMTWARAGP